jgi:fructose-bisphosphate aldolase class II
MALVSMRQLLDHAAEFSYGLPAFNVNNLEQMRAIMEAADKCDAPVIVQASAGARKYAGAPFLRHMILAAVEEFPHIPVVMHQDHGTSPDVCQRSIQLGFSSVMMDGSLKSDGKTPANYDYNVEVTRTVVNFSTHAACRWKVKSAAWAAWKPAWPAKKTAWAPKACWTTASS